MLQIKNKYWINDAVQVVNNPTKYIIYRVSVGGSGWVEYQLWNPSDNSYNWYEEHQLGPVWRPIWFNTDD